MKKYFYTDGSEKYGPASLEELKKAKINGNTLVWHQGLEDWKSAKEIDEILEFLQLIPPQIPTKVQGDSFLDEKRAEIHNRISDDKIEVNRNSTKLFSYQGRIRRTEYFLSILIYIILSGILNYWLETGVNGLIIFFYIPLLWFLWSQGAKRCHDIGNSGWYQIIPFYFIWMLIARSDKEENRFGMNTKY